MYQDKTDPMLGQQIHDYLIKMNVETPLDYELTSVVETNKLIRLKRIF